jgi:phosphodiesterase/alkaline phosphatase D-like protein
VSGARRGREQAADRPLTTARLAAQRPVPPLQPPAGFGVQYGLSPDKLTFVPSYNCSNFTTNSPSTAWQNQVLLTGLTPDTTYYYIAGSVDFREPWSQVYSFRYQPAREGGPIFAIFADFGFYNDESLEAMLADAFEGNIDYVLHAGDFA